MGIGFGLGAGAFVALVNTHQRDDHFDDFTYWINDDGIRMFQEGAEAANASLNHFARFRMLADVARQSEEFKGDINRDIIRRKAFG